MAAGVVAEAGAGGGQSSTMVPVRSCRSERPRPRARRRGTIEIDFGRRRAGKPARRGIVPAMLRQVIELLR